VPIFDGYIQLPAPQGDVKFIFDHHKVDIFQVLSFRMTYFTDPWILPSPSATMEGAGNSGMSMPLSVVEVVYSLVQQASTNPDPTPVQEFNPLLEPIWAQGSLTITDSLELVLPSDEEVIEAMTSPEKPWDDLHHKSYFLPELSRIEAREFTLTMNGYRTCPINPLAIHDVYAEGNMENIVETISINISITPSIMENVFIGADCSLGEIQIYTDLFKEFHDIFSWSYEEMLRIDPKIVEHEITNYPDAKPIR
jgi:hypothetical protein